MDKAGTVPTVDFLPYGRHSIDEDDVAAVTEVLRSDWLTTGPPISEFEEAFATTVDAKYAVSCSSGTAALHLSALALALSEDDVAIVPAVTFLATANAVRYVGAEVAFCDVDPHTGLMSVSTVDNCFERLDPKTRKRVKAFFPVHLNGQICDIAALRQRADAHDAAIVEDACHALGSRYGPNSSPAGDCQFGDLSVFSFHPVKIIATGEGGMITTNESDLQDRLRLLRSHGMTRTPEHFRNADLGFGPDGEPNPWYYEMYEPGFNYRLSAIQAALGLSQLSKLGRFAARRQALAALYNQELAPLAPIVRPLDRVAGSEPAWHLYVVQIDFDALAMTRAELMRRLREAGIGTQVHYIPLHLQPYYQERYGETSLPGAEAYYGSILSLPLFPAMVDQDVQRVCGALADVVAERT